MSKLIVGIDPGKEGGIAILTLTGVESVRPMPLIGDEIDGAELRSIILTYPTDSIIVGIEKVGARPGQGSVSTFTFGHGCGIIEGVVQALAWPYVKVMPKTWQKVAFEGISPITKIEKGKTKNDPKKMALVAASRLYPDVNLLASERCKVPHSGIVDALLIAHYLKVTNR